MLMRSTTTSVYTTLPALCCCVHASRECQQLDDEIIIAKQTAALFVQAGRSASESWTAATANENQEDTFKHCVRPNRWH